jgi:hypothetical protein
LKSSQNHDEVTALKEIVKLKFEKDIPSAEEKNLELIPTGVLARAYRRMGAKEREEERAMERASVGPYRGELRSRGSEEKRIIKREDREDR